MVGTASGEPFVSSPMYKQRFGLRTGVCLDDPSVRVRVFSVDVVDGVVVIGHPDW